MPGGVAGGRGLRARATMPIEGRLAAAGAGADAALRNGDGQVGLAGAADQDDIALLFDQAATGEIGDQGLVDRGGVGLEAVGLPSATG